MFQNLYPDEEYRSSYEIPYESYYQKGFRGILFDVEIGFEVCIISNNKEPRVKPLADTLGAKYVYKADKPSAKGYVQGMEHMGTTASNTMFVGDQIFTDIWGAKRAGVYAVLVHPIAKHEEIQIVLKRKLEWFVLRRYHKKRS